MQVSVGCGIELTRFLPRLKPVGFRVVSAVSMAVVRVVSAAEGRKPQSLPPLVNVLNADALNALFGPRGDGTARTGGRISVVYSNCRLTIDNGEHLTCQLLENHSSRDDNSRQR